MKTLGYPQIETTFTQYQLDEGSFLLDEMQQAHIQTQMAITAQQQLNLSLDPQNPVDFGLQHSFLKGQVSAYQFLLDLSVANFDLLKQTKQGQTS